MNEKTLKLGQEVTLLGKLVKVDVSPKAVADAEARIKSTATPEISRKYKVEEFPQPRTGIVVGVRSVVKERIHFMNGPILDTKTIRQRVLVVACDLRGQYLVPMDKVVVKEEWPHIIGVDYEEFQPETYRGVYLAKGGERVLRIDTDNF
ncbi:hypothetical protein [Rossellomorea vietnamensis]|uniref:hypothetical protein n=1 Tax=Rossellomorea vietnamensis TaxID=218284 RepID=UPI001E2EA7CD|nr:hypothetical protein [Rossellomorea vietnamensis]MCC5802252.1 hypothetical protein [Rossellomorea vietnamensis]